MSKGFKVTIQTKPYLKKYLHKLYGEPLHFSANNEFGICIAAFLHRPVSNRLVIPEQQTGLTLANKIRHGKEVLRMRVDRFEDQLDIHLPKSFLEQRRGGYEITDQHTIILNKLFEKKFEADVWRLCTVMNILGIEVKEALVEICDSYDIIIDEDITLEALQKKEFRFRKKMELSAPQLSAESVKKSIKKIVFHTVRNGNRHA